MQDRQPHRTIAADFVEARASRRARLGLGGLRRCWLACIAATGLVALLPSTKALAQCATAGTDPVTVTCAANTTTTATTNTTSPNPATSDRTQQFNADIAGQVDAAVTVSGVGLALTTTKAGGSVSLTNSGAISTTAAPNVVELDGNGGTVSYAGNGTISTSTAGAAGLVLSNTGAGTIVVNAAGAIGGGPTRVSTGVAATTASGAINLTTGTIAAVNDGITANTGGGGIMIVANGGINVVGSHDIVTGISGGTGNTAITYNGTLVSTGSGGIVATSSSTGTMSVGGSGSINSTGAGNAIQVTNSAAATSGDITINPTGSISAGGNTAILAQVTNAANNANIIVDPTGVLVAGSGISAGTAGGGNVTVTAVNTITANVGAGITTTTTGGTNTVNITGGTQSAAGANVSATSGSGNIAVIVTNGALLQGTGGSTGGIAASSGSGNIVVDTSAGLLGTGGVRVGTGVAATTTSGAVNVTTGAIAAVSDGITANTGGGGITIVANGGINVVGFHDIVTGISGGTGNTAIIYNGTLVSTGTGGILATSSSTGTMSVGGSGSINSTAAGNAIQVTNSAAATSGDITINPTGSISAGGNTAILAQVTNAANNANIIVDPTGVLVAGRGIAAGTAGGGNVTVTAVNTITANVGAGITTTTTSGTNTVNITGGTQSAAGANVSATSGSGNIAVIVTNGALLQGTGGSTGGIAASSGSGNIVVDTSAGLLGTGGVRVGTGVAATTTSGAVNVTTGAIAAVSDGITAGTSGGGITIVANGGINVVGFHDIATAISGGTGNTAITYNGTLVSTGTGGILATSSSTGTMSVGGSGSINSTAAGNGIQVTNSASATSGDITINPSGSISAGGNTAILAQVTNAANNANIIVDPTGVLVAGNGVSAGTAGGGNVTVTTVNTITANIGAGITATTTSGTNTVDIRSGTVQAATNGVDMTAGTGRMVVSNAGTISATQIGVKLTGGSANEVDNSGTISGAIGLSAAGATAVFNAGAITGAGGTAIQFAGGGNTLTIAPTSVITGNAIGAGADTFQLGGTGTGSFAASLIGPAAQYRGFAAYNKVGDSTWTLTGSNALALPWTVSQGTLDVAGSLANSPFTVQAGALAVTGTIGTASVTGGSFAVLGGGHSGAVTQTAGTASVDGTAGAFALSGGTLFGNGTLASLTVTGGTVAPGHSIGTLNVAGNVGFSGGFYQVETNLAGLSDKIVATGTASLTGGTVQAVVQAGSYAGPTTTTILTANGGVSGAFSGATSSVPYLTVTLSYDANDVFLTLSRNLSFFSDQAQTPNQRAVAAALDQFPSGNAVLLSAAALTGATTRQALDNLSGEVHAGVQSSLIDDSLYLREAVLGRMRQGMFAASTGQLAAFGSVGPALAYQTPSNSYAAAFPVKASPAADYDPTWWTQGIGARGTFDGDGNASDIKRSLGGFVTGLDRRLGENWLAGLAAGYGRSTLNVDARASAANIDTALISAYAAASYGPWNLRSGLGYSWSGIDTNRTIAFPGFIDRTTARYNAQTSQIFAELGYAKAFGDLAVEPFVGLSYVHLNAGGFTETGLGSGAALSGQGANENVGYSSLGVRLAQSFALTNGMTLLPHVATYWQRAYGDLAPTRALAFVNPTTAFSIAGVPLARDAEVVDGGLDLKLNARARLGISYLGHLGSHVGDHAAKGSFSLSF